MHLHTSPHAPSLEDTHHVPLTHRCPVAAAALGRSSAWHGPTSNLPFPPSLPYSCPVCHSVATLVPLRASEMSSSTCRPFLVLPSLCFKSPGGRVAFCHLVPGPSALRVSAQHGASPSCCPCSRSAAQPFVSAPQRVTQFETNARRSIP